MVFKKSKMFIIIFSMIMLLSFLEISYASAGLDCISCHDAVRHGQKDNKFCINCHINYDVQGEIHPDAGISDIIPFVHRAFDWEGDNQVEGDMPEDESCPACHVRTHEMISARDAPDLFRKCEDCHIQGGTGPVSAQPGWDLRSDIDSFIPKVYAHYNGSKIIDVDSQRGVFNGSSISSCFDYNVNTGEGTCHSVREMFSAEAGNYFAHINDSEKSKVSGLYMNPSDPYQFDLIIDNMPDTSDCMFCHFQQNESIRLVWGGAVQPASEIHINVTNTDCWNCHTRNGKKPASFHSNSMGDKEKRSLPIGTIAMGAGAVVVAAGAAYYLFAAKKK